MRFKTSTRPNGLVAFSLMVLPMLLSTLSPVMASTVSMQDDATGLQREEIWSAEYSNYEFPWGGNDAVQFKEYHTYFTMKDRMQEIAELNPEFIEFHEGLNGGINDRDQETTQETYKGWYYNHASPWLKITGNISDGEYNEFNGDGGNFEDREDVLIVGNHHAREWMSYEVPMFMIETLVFAYNNIGYDNDGDGLVDEDPWGDADGDGILDDDGDCLRLAPELQDSDGDGIACGPGDLGVDEDHSEQKLHDLVNTREIYIIPMLNVDGNRYDREEYCGETAWENCATSGWRKNLRDNTVTGVTPLPDLDEQVDEGCDGVDLNRNYQFEWGAPLGATGPLFPGACYAGQNNDVYNGPVDDTDNDGDGQWNEDHVDGKDDDADGLVDEDWWGGNTEPETKFIQDLTEMNDDNNNGGSDFPVTLTWHSFSELILYPWGHCQNCDNPDQEQLKYHGDVMATMSNYENMQSSGLYPTSGDFCDWHYGLFTSYCYTMEIGNAFHEQPQNIDDILLRNVGMGMYMIEIADNPKERADLAIANISQQNYLKAPEKTTIPDEGDIPIEVCVSDNFPVSISSSSYVEWRLVKPSRLQSDYGPREWATTPWEKVQLESTGLECPIAIGNGTLLQAMIPISETQTGELHYKAQLSTRDGIDFIQYPADGNYLTLDLTYREAYGSLFGSLVLFTLVAGTIWGSLGVCLRIMLTDQEESVYEASAVLDAEAV
ncbi:MAG: hypothetical protein HOJ55_03450 [Euryarchaeota archaeon]|jgi:hypothetical protein|nr:hypothetical protein [Euryarchaeota archaeon]MBT5592884.1 hypothetical protein [Euryarchaeota archaeon]